MRPSVDDKYRPAAVHFTIHGCSKVSSTIHSCSIEISGAVYSQTRKRGQPIGGACGKGVENRFRAGGVDFEDSTQDVRSTLCGRSIEVSGSVHDQSRSGNQPIGGGCAEGVQNRFRAGGGDLENRTLEVRSTLCGRAIEVSGAVHDQTPIWARSIGVAYAEGVENRFRVGRIDLVDRARAARSTHASHSIQVSGTVHDQTPIWVHSIVGACAEGVEDGFCTGSINLEDRADLV